MQRVVLSQLKPGMITARNIYDGDGRKLLSSDMALTSKFIERLAELKVSAVYITNSYMEGIEVEPIVREEVRVKTVQTVKRVFSMLDSPRKDVPYREIQALGRKIVSDVLRNKDAMLHLNEIRTYDDYTFAHSVDVCTVAVLIGTGMNCGEDRLRELALGSLLHDVGKMLVAPEILNKPALLTEEEMSIMKGHSQFGFELLRGSEKGISLPAMHVAFQHHEKFDGNGYPRGLKGMEIHEYARIVAIADVYDAVISDRPYRPALLPHEAYEIILASNSIHFDPNILPHFLSKIALYPIGTMVQLNTGDIGLVIDVQSGMQSRPTVRLVQDRHARFYPPETDVDMRNHLTVFIDQVIRDKTVFELTGNN